MVQQPSGDEDFSFSKKGLKIRMRVLYSIVSSGILAAAGFVWHEGSDLKGRLDSVESNQRDMHTVVEVVKDQQQFTRQEQQYMRQDMRDFMQFYGVTPKTPTPSIAPIPTATKPSN